MAKKLTAEKVLRLQTAEDLSPAEVKELQELAVASSSNEIALQGEKDELTQKLEALSTENSELTGVVPGTFKHGKKEYRFVKGALKTRNMDGQIVASVELLEDAKEMEYLIKMGYGLIEEVK